VILAVAGSAVGIGNFLRFPGLAAKYDGGVFLIPYFVSLLVIGIPICWCEWTIGRAGGVRGYNSAPGIFRVMWSPRASRWVGGLALVVPVTIYMYYVYIEAWCLAYCWFYLTGALDLGPDPARYAEFFETFVGTREDGLVTAGPAVVFLGVSFVLNFVLIYRGLSKGIEKFCMYALPLLNVIALVVLARVLTLGTPNPAHPEQNVTNGLGFMWNPKLPEGGSVWVALANPDMWLQAAGQIFFTLGVGFGIILTYASYLKRKDDVVLSGLTATATNEFSEVVLGGLITIPAAFMFLGADPIQKVAGSSIGLGFYTLPVIFDYIPVGRLFGFLWFVLLFLAALASSISMLQPSIAFLEEGFDVGRRVSVTLLGTVTAIGSLFVVHFSKDLMALEVMDFWVGQVMIFTLGTIIVIVFGWVIGMERGLAEAHQGAAMRIPRMFHHVIKYVSPAYLLLIFAGFLYQNVGDYVAKVLADRAATFTALFIAVLFAFFTLLVHQAGQRWDAKEAARTRRREVA
jgi:SNF family Na+-dependent transporter